MSAKKTSVRKPRSTKKTQPRKSAAQQKTPSHLTRLRNRISGLRARRPHRSFHLTRRRDYRRSLGLPGYLSFTFSVFRTLRLHWRVMGLVVIVYTILGLILGTMTSQSTYSQLSATASETGKSLLNFDGAAIFEAGTVAVLAFVGNSDQTEVQRVYAGLVFILTWLCVVWLLREYMAGRSPKFRDGLYNSSAPLISTVLLGLWSLVQLIPVGLATLAYVTLSTSGLVGSGFGMFIISLLFATIIALSLYWLTSTFFALVIVTLPGMYPMQAIRAAGDLVLGRRLRILYRMLWLLFTTVVGWLIVIIPTIMLTDWLDNYWKWMTTIPIVPFIALLLSSVTSIWVASYIYLLYRKVVDDDTKPA